MQVAQIYPDKDAEAFVAWYSIWRATDEEKFPGEPGWDEQDIATMALSHAFDDTQLLTARTDDGSVVGAVMLHVPVRDNRHAVGTDLRVDASQRRRGIGREILAAVERRAIDDGRTMLNCINEVPIGQEKTHPSVPFLEAMGFVATQPGHRRHLSLPIESARLAELRKDIASARGAGDYRVLTFVDEWPDEFIEDQCALERAMSTDQPLGDQLAEEEDWDAARVAEAAATVKAQGMTSLVTAAQHIESGRIVAYSRIVVAERRPTEAWQWATIVLDAHRGHRLGLAVKVANLDFLAEVMPSARRVLTGNAAVNAPMIGVNDLMGFEIDAAGAFWQKSLLSP